MKSVRHTAPTFPHPELADEDGVVAVGGKLTTARLLEAYSKGIFPWPHWGLLLWFSPDPRCILAPSEVRVTKSMERILKAGKFRITFDEAFSSVIQSCSGIPRSGEPGTWITEDIQAAYCTMHQEGYAHSVEAWIDDKLAGGLYGLSLGRAFFGESMFSHESNASKACFITLCRQLQAWNFDMIDCQLPTDHLLRLGARSVPRADYLKALSQTLTHSTLRGKWTQDLPKI